MYEPQKFSEYFNLGQNKLDFVNIYANQDIPLFLDPFGISAIGTEWAKECENQIATYFQYLIDSIRVGDRKSIKKLLSALHEVNEIALGYSQGSPQGRGIGKIQAKQMLFAFENSEAAKSGDIQDIADCALLIPGISRDKISDITANILKRKLVEYTQKQCKKHNIPMQRAAINNAFDFSTMQFSSYFSDLPIVNGKPKILLPLSAVRQDPELSRDKYYRNFVLEYLQAEHEHPGDSLATVLRNGRVVVRIKDLKVKYPNNVDYLYNFNKEHPEILEKYKSELRRTALTQDKTHLQTTRKVLNSIETENILKNLNTGNDDANRFHQLMFGSLCQIFSNQISNPTYEKAINDNLKRVDITFNNISIKGFLHSLKSNHKIKCPRIMIECKNYVNDIGNPEIDQLIGRLNDKRGRFGILVCRNIKDKSRMLKRCKDVLNDNSNYIIILEDNDIVTLLKYKELKNYKAIDDFFELKMDELIM